MCGRPAWLAHQPFPNALGRNETLCWAKPSPAPTAQRPAVTRRGGGEEAADPGGPGGAGEALAVTRGSAPTPACAFWVPVGGGVSGVLGWLAGKVVYRCASFSFVKKLFGFLLKAKSVTSEGKI